MVNYLPEKYASIRRLHYTKGLYISPVQMS